MKNFNLARKMSNRSIHSYTNHKINTVVFDMYETVIFPKKHLRPAPVQAFIDTFNFYGFFPASSSVLINHKDVFINIVDKHMGKSKRNHLISILNEPYMKSFNESIKKDKITLDEMYAKFVDIQCDLLKNPDYCTLEPNYLKVEKHLIDHGIQNICFTTGFNHLQTSIILHHLPELKYNKIITTDSVTLPRPNPEGIYKIIKHCNVFDYNVIKIGDTVADIEEANNASVISVGVTTGAVSIDKFKDHNADFVIKNLLYLPYLINCINRKNK